MLFGACAAATALAVVGHRWLPALIVVAAAMGTLPEIARRRILASGHPRPERTVKAPRTEPAEPPPRPERTVKAPRTEPVALVKPDTRSIPATATPFARWEDAKQLAKAGAGDEAIAELRHILDEGFGLAGLTLGEILREAGDEPGAEAAYEAAARLSTTPSAIAAARLNQGLFCERRGDFAAAADCYRAAITQDASASATAQLMLDALASRKVGLSGA